MHSTPTMTFSTPLPGELLTKPIETEIVNVDDLTAVLNRWNSMGYDADKLVQHTPDSYLVVFKRRPKVNVTYHGGRTSYSDLMDS